MTRLTRADELRLDAVAKRQELANTLDQLVAKADWRSHVARGRRKRIVRATAATVGVALGAAAVAVGALRQAARSRSVGGRGAWRGRRGR
ncbi:hypothetical protein I3F58_08470 [Streptomyces sp. MUM 203J]|uniref:hypothetical protein n=1 Tax=Streptomyces sp. MUM 203J TaxID=2791990 RepID=UPI001F04FF07|nr:hypothetical protein [Streptomyces sp. MUM 203J]MCH0539601.1 hypothetical protein [Streptomyces sp. MUM 203J]